MSGTDSDTGAVLVCGEHFDGHSDGLGGPVEILVQGGVIREIGPQVRRPRGARVVDLGRHTVTPGFIDCHVHLTMNAANLAVQLLDSAATKALTGLHIACQYMERGFTTLRDLGSADPAWPTVDLRNALDGASWRGRG